MHYQSKIFLLFFALGFGGCASLQKPEFDCRGENINGRREDIWTCYQNGHLFSEVFYHDGEKAGPSTFYWPDGKIQSHSHWKHNLFDGVFESYDQSGQKRFFAHFERGHREGVGREWGPDGKLQVEIWYHLDGREGPTLTFYQNGKRRSSATYHLSAIQGEYQDWYESGKDRCHGRYALGISENLQCKDENGKILSEPLDPIEI